jgi:hypothetical protein
MNNALLILLLAATPAAAHDWWPHRSRCANDPCSDPTLGRLTCDERNELCRAQAQGRLDCIGLIVDAESQRAVANQYALVGYHLAYPYKSTLPWNYAPSMPSAPVSPAFRR